MTHTSRNNPSRFSGTLRFLSAGFAAAILSITSLAQSPSPSPSSTDSDGRYSVKASTEIGGRWVDVNGFENKFRSDLNYKTGFRVFDSSIYVEDNGEGSNYKAFDSALIMASGWGSDPTGFIRANIERDGVYRLDTTVRRVSYFNLLNNHAVGETKISYDNYDTRRNFGDLDLTLLPDNRKIRFRLGGSYNISNGTFTYTTRQSNAFPFDADARTKAYDLRAGADGSLLGFNFSGTYGYRNFSDRTTFTLVGPEEGSNVDTYDFLSAQRSSPISGRTHFGMFSVQRTIANKLDFTARILHSRTSNEFSWNEASRFFYASTSVITTEQLNITGQSSRPQTRGDLGITWRVTDKFRISNTFTYDGFNLNGGNLYLLGSTRSGASSRQHNYTFTRYRRYMNLIEGDYQFNNRFAVNLGYRYTTRDFQILWTAFNVATNPPTLVAGTGEIEEGDNTTNTVIAGTRIKPLKNWTLYADLEKGKADNVFTRAGNADFTNFRIRSQMRFDKVSANVSFISRDNEIPTDLSRAVPRITDNKSRIFSATLDWNPIDELNLTGGYNYTHLTSRATVNFIPTLADALSEYFVRDNYFFIDATVRPHKRITFFGSYRWNKDRAYGDREIPALAAPYILGGYPIDFKAPEFRAAIKLNRYVDWNIGYQYYDYKEEPVQNVQWALPFQNYSAHMPYMSLRIYLGRGAGDR